MRALTCNVGCPEVKIRSDDSEWVKPPPLVDYIVIKKQTDRESVGKDLTVKELIEKLSKLNQSSLVYTMAHDDDIALIVTDVFENALEGKEETITLIY